MKWISVSWVLCDRKMPLKLKGKFSKIVIRLAMLYGTICWAIQKQHVHKMSVTEMIMLRWISGTTRKDRIPKEEICLMISVAPNDENMGKSYLR